MANEKKRSKLVPILCICAATLVLLSAAVLYFGGFIGNATMKNGVYIAGVNVSGMTHKEVVQCVNSAIEKTYPKSPMQVKVGDQLTTIYPTDSGVKLRTELAVTMAFITRADAGHFDLSPYLKLDKEKVQQMLAPMEDPYRESSFTQSSYSITGSRPALTEDHVEDPTQKLEIFMGTPAYTFSADDLYATVLAGYSSNQMSVEYEVPTKSPDAIDLDKIQKEHYVEPVSAEMDRKTFEVSQHTYGYGLDLESAKEALRAAKYGESISIDFVRIAPEWTYESLKAILFRDVLATYTSTSGSSYNRRTNMRLACEAINGQVVFPGDTFSYSNTLGERTPEKGYKPAPMYVGSESVASYGGGICQPSSTLYYCTLMADLETVERHNHGFFCSYVPAGMDATIAWGSCDFIFRNNQEYPIRIDAVADGDSVTITLYGTDTKDYYVKMEYEIWAVNSWKTVEKEFPPNNSKGYKDGQEITSPYTGYTVQTYKCKYDKETDALISREKEAYSVYNKRDRVVAKIVDPNAPSTDTPADTPADTPDTPAVPDTPVTPTPPVTPDE